MKKFDKLINNKQTKYYYNFDYLMHNYIINTFKKNFYKKNCLELGSGYGNFTKLLSKYFKDITIIEGSIKSIKFIKKLKIPKLKIINQDLEKINFFLKYDNIFLIHTLEHLKYRKKFLNRLKRNLTKNGKLFIACPNANAASRQIAVQMGLIKKETTVTKSEKNHGHHVTYNLNSLRREVKSAGLNIIDSGGVFFKPLANFQIDISIKENIINQKFLDACFKIGFKYPDMCSSIFVIAKK